jgi:hypothetical protein
MYQPLSSLVSKCRDQDVSRAFEQAGRARRAQVAAEAAAGTSGHRVPERVSDGRPATKIAKRQFVGGPASR